MKPRYIHVGSMNIERFGEDDNNPDNQYALAEHIELSGVAVLALQELYVTNGATGDQVRENSFLQDTLDLIEEHTGQKWQYEIFRNRKDDDADQLCGMAWNTAKVTQEGDTFPIPVETVVREGGKDYWLWDRLPHAMKFRAVPGTDPDLKLTDFVAISVHMKSNVGRQEEVQKKRHLEAIQLVENLAKIEDALEDSEIMILGDTNCKDRFEEAIKTLVAAGFDDLNEDDVSTFYRGNSAPFDRIFVRQNRQPFQYSRQYVLRSASPLAHDKFLSDHYMIKTSVVVRRDTD